MRRLTAGLAGLAMLAGRQLTLAVYYLRSYKGRRSLAPEWHQVPATRAVAVAALGELLGGQPLCRGSRRPFLAGTRRSWAQGHATAARGAPGRGPFSGSLSFTAPAAAHAWTLEAFEVSPEDGAITYVVQVPVWVGR
jgi:hypothetical protein